MILCDCHSQGVHVDSGVVVAWTEMLAIGTQRINVRNILVEELASFS